MTNVLYVGHYEERSGWGQVARDKILALDSVGINVVPRSIKLGLADFDVPSRIKELENNDITECDTIIQHVLPHYMKYDSHFRKNIGIFELETKNIKHTQWVDHLNIMDELWVPCSDMCSLDGVNTKTILLPHACDIEQYAKTYDKLSIPNIQDKFVFYFIGQYNRRKHLSALLRAFHTEFSPFEQVELIIKTNKPGVSPENLSQEIIELCTKIKHHLNLYVDLDTYKAETIITVDIARDEMLRLHASCDCLVCPSHGEAWCIPAFEAMAMSNIVIAGRTGGPQDYIEHGVSGLLVDGNMAPVFGETDGMWGFGTAREIEFDISILDLQKQMRHAYRHRNDLRSMKDAAVTTAQKYDYKIIGTQMKELIDA